MATKQINDYTGQSPLLTDDSLLMQTAAGVTKRVEATNLKLVGYEDYLVANLDLGKSTDSPSFLTYRDTFKCYAFPDNAVKEGHGDLHILHNYVAGSTIYPHIHWSSNAATPTGNVQWKMDYAIARGHATNEEAFPAFTTLTFPVSACTAQYYHTIVEHVAGIASASIETDSLILLRIYRDTVDAADTLTGDAFLFRVDFHVQIDSMATKEKAAPFTKV